LYGEANLIVILIAVVLTSFMSIGLAMALSASAVRREVESKSLLPYGFKGTILIIAGSILLFPILGRILFQLIVYRVIVIDALEILLLCSGLILMILGFRMKVH